MLFLLPHGLGFRAFRHQYTGTDISPSLLRKAVKSFKVAGFKEAEFYVTSADDLPFDDNGFDIALCILSLNFFVGNRLLSGEQ